MSLTIPSSTYNFQNSLDSVVLTPTVTTPTFSSYVTSDDSSPTEGSPFERQINDALEPSSPHFGFNLFGGPGKSSPAIIISKPEETTLSVSPSAPGSVLSDSTFANILRSIQGQDEAAAKNDSIVDIKISDANLDLSGIGCGDEASSPSGNQGTDVVDNSPKLFSQGFGPELSSSPVSDVVRKLSFNSLGHSSGHTPCGKNRNSPLFLFPSVSDEEFDSPSFNVLPSPHSNSASSSTSNDVFTTFDSLNITGNSSPPGFNAGRPWSTSSSNGPLPIGQATAPFSKLSSKQTIECLKLLQEIEENNRATNGDGMRQARASCLKHVLQQHLFNQVVLPSSKEPATSSFGSVSQLHGPPSVSEDNDLERVSRYHREVAELRDAPCTWSGQLPPRNHRNPTYSCKVFLGGLPWDISEGALHSALRVFGNVRIEWPGKDGNSSQPKGFVYAIFDSEKQVKNLLQHCTYDFSREGSWFYKISSRRMRAKDVQVIPWALSDSNFSCPGAPVKLDPQKTIFVGGLHGVLNAEGLAMVMDNLFGGVIYAGIDTDRHKYPIGSGRVTFISHKSYMKAVVAAFVEIKAHKFDKKVQLDPYLEDSNCSICRLQHGPYFCRDWSCFRYYCRTCFQQCHTVDMLHSHRPIMRNTCKHGQGSTSSSDGAVAFGGTIQQQYQEPFFGFGHCNGSGHGNGNGNGNGNGQGDGHGNRGHGNGHGQGFGYGNGHGQGFGHGHEYGHGHGNGNGYGHGHSNGNGNGYGYGQGNGYGYGNGRGYSHGPGYHGNGNGQGQGHYRRNQHRVLPHSVYPHPSGSFGNHNISSPSSWNSNGYHNNHRW